MKYTWRILKDTIIKVIHKKLLERLQVIGHVPGC